MTEDIPPNPALLPTGLRDLLPPDAETEASAVEAVMDHFAGHGYQRVKPPLLEFEDSLLAATGAAMADQVFRLMDPDTHRMMAIRADMTPQVARIAATRLARAPRPLRLSYSGQSLRVRGSQLDPDRQVPQAGIELIGPDTPEADAEVVAVGAEALAALGLALLSFDLTMPPLVPALLEESGIEGPQRTALGRALDRKDAAGVAEHGGMLSTTLTNLLLAAGPAASALEALAAADLPPRTRALAQRLAATVAAIQARAPDLKLTVDPIEFRGLKYHTGVCMTVYALDCHEELGRGGRYICGEDEAATGLTIYPDAVLRAAPSREARRRVFVPQGADGRSLRAEGYATVAGLAPVANNLAEAHRLGCTHVLIEGRLTALPAE
jgi:ATP phosphoribosyltransferase regulatory subunit